MINTYCLPNNYFSPIIWSKPDLWGIMGKILDLTGKKFNRLTVLEFDRLDRGKGLSFWKCLCECGVEFIRAGTHIKKGIVKSCGCLSLEKSKENISGVRSRRKRIYEGGKPHPAYATINGMIQRCYNKKCREYRWYGARDITVCDAWKNNKTEFVKWAIENGWKKGLCIDRKNNAKGYSPENCSFITKQQNLKKVRLDNLANGYEYSRGRIPVMEGIIE